MNDFDQIMANANSNTTKSNKSFDKNAWRERKQQERQEVYDLMDKTADEIKTDINKYKQYLDVQGRFDKYSVGNALVISATYPNATQIKEFDDWKESGAFIKKGANGIKILEPGDSYTRSDGSSAISYNVKKMFDISQTTSTQKPRTINYDDRVKLTALLKDCPVDIKAVDEIPNSDKVALWNKEDNVLYVKRGGETYFKQVTKILDKEKTKIVYNSEWLNKMNFKDVLELTGKYTVARLLERDDFSNRFNNKTPIGVHEFMYPLMQGYDSVAIHADIEIGGTDQTFNLLVGRELQKDYGQEQQDVIVFPLLVGLDGKEKMSKSLDNYIGIDEEPSIMFEKSMRIPDSCLENYFRLTTDIDTNTYKDWINTDIVDAHRKYAREIIKMYHGEKFIKDAEDKYNAKANKTLSDNIDTIKYNGELPIFIIDLLNELKIVSSKSEGRRLIEQNGISVNQKKENNINRVITKEDFNDGFIIIQKGKKVFLKVEI